jgi:hypothetical protein
LNNRRGLLRRRLRGREFEWRRDWWRALRRRVARGLGCCAGFLLHLREQEFVDAVLVLPRDFDHVEERGLFDLAAADEFFDFAVFGVGFGEFARDRDRFGLGFECDDLVMMRLIPGALLVFGCWGGAREQDRERGDEDGKDGERCD